MRFLETLQSRKIATGLVIAIGVLSLSGCNDGFRESKSGGLRLDKGILYVPGDSDGKSTTLYCQGHVLVEHYERERVFDHTHKNINDPVCEDGILTPEDFQPSDHLSGPAAK